MPPHLQQPSCFGTDTRMKSSESVAVTLDTVTVESDRYRPLPSGEPQMRKVTESRGNSRFGSVVYKTQEGLEAPLLGDTAAAGRGDSHSDPFYEKDVERAAGGAGGVGETERAKGIRGEEEYRRIEHRGNSGFIDSVFNGINVLAGEWLVANLHRHSLNAIRHGASGLAGHRHFLNAMRHGASGLAGSARSSLVSTSAPPHRPLPHGLPSPTGIGILSTPYATAQAGWLGLLVLLFFAAACCYTAMLIRFPSPSPFRSHRHWHSLNAIRDGASRLAGFARIGILSTPYATAQAGWLGLLVLLFFAAACCYTAILLRRCMDFQPSSSPSVSSLHSFADGPADSARARASPRASARIVRAQRPIRSYPDIGEAAFGRAGRWLTAFLLYFELYAVTVELLILEGDNLAHLFPSGDICVLPGSLVGKESTGVEESGGVWFLEGIARGGGVRGEGGEGQGEGMFGAAAALASAVVRGIEPALETVALSTGVGSLCLEPKQFYVILSALLVLPTVWLRDLSLLAYISAGGVLASLLLVFGVGWLKEVDHIGDIPGGISSTTEWFKPMGLPAAAGLFGFCFSGHAVVPNIYRSMKKPDHFTPVMLVSFAACTLLYGGMALMGYAMFGASVQSQITLNLPPALSASKAVVWTTVVNPFTKFALTLLPIALALEETLPTAHPHSLPQSDSHSHSHSRSHSHSHSHSTREGGVSCEGDADVMEGGCTGTGTGAGTGSGTGLRTGTGEGTEAGVQAGMGKGMDMGMGVDSWQHIASATALRTALVAGAVTVALSVPFFGLVMAFIGSFLSLSISVMLPCACYVKLMGGPWREGGRLGWGEVVGVMGLFLIGLLAAASGTFYAVRGITDEW
ncbi:unnamed protein product [Closterium sp. Yama58-4]|nr:unnamed protein product [Closterium sp. Yama58-4]